LLGSDRAYDTSGLLLVVAAICPIRLKFYSRYTEIKEWSDVCKRMHMLALVMYLFSACRCVVLLLQ